MAGKSIKLIVGIVLLVVAILLYLLSNLSYWLAIAIAAIGLILVVLSFLGKKQLPAVVTPKSEEGAPETKTQTPAEPTPEESGVEVPPAAPPQEPPTPPTPPSEEQKSQF